MFKNTDILLAKLGKGGRPSSESLKYLTRSPTYCTNM